MHFETLPHPAPMPADARDEALKDPGFGTLFSDHMVTIDYDEAAGGWQDGVVGPRQPIMLDPEFLSLFEIFASRVGAELDDDLRPPFPQ